MSGHTYFASAVGDRSGDVLYTGEFRAIDFADAVQEAEERARARAIGEGIRLTSVVEQPDVNVRGPVSLALDIARSR